MQGKNWIRYKGESLQKYILDHKIPYYYYGRVLYLLRKKDISNWVEKDMDKFITGVLKTPRPQGLYKRAHELGLDTQEAARVWYLTKVKRNSFEKAVEILKEEKQDLHKNITDFIKEKRND